MIPNIRFGCCFEGGAPAVAGAWSCVADGAAGAVCPTVSEFEGGVFCWPKHIWEKKLKSANQTAILNTDLMDNDSPSENLI